MSFLSSDTDVIFEEEVKRDPHRVKIWFGYLATRPSLFSTEESKQKVPLSAEQTGHLIRWRVSIYERGLSYLPGSYKLWYAYLQECVAAVRKNESIQNGSAENVEKFEIPDSLRKDMNRLTDSRYVPKTDLLLLLGNNKGSSMTIINEGRANDVFERCLVHQSKRPRIWLLYCSFLRSQNLISRTRRAYDRCLRSIPLTQHDLVWESILDFAENCGVFKTGFCFFTRYIMLEPGNIEKFIDFLLLHKKYDNAASLLARALNDDGFRSIKNKSNHQLWMELCDLLSTHSVEIKSLDVEKVLRCGLMRFSDEVGRLWCSLADHFTAQGLIEQARDVYEEAMVCVTNVHDFVMVFDAYAAFQESVITAKMEMETPQDSKTHEIELDIYIARLDDLLERRAELLSSVRLRQNPHNVNEWLSRVKLFSENPLKVIETFSDAVRVIESHKAVGKLSLLWLKFTRYYEDFGNLDDARFIFQKATQVDFKGIDDLASIWCGWVEFELRNGYNEKALQVARQMIHRPANTDSLTAQGRLYRSVKLWSLAADMEESFGKLETVRAVYDKMFAVKVITPQLVMNFAQYLQEKKFFEESYKVYERGIALFKWPHRSDVLLVYLTKIVERLGRTKLERARELFEQAILDVPEKFSKRFYLLYAKLEEEFGLAKHALAIYNKATQVVPLSSKLEMYKIYIVKTQEMYGIVKTRPIYEQAIAILPDEQAKELCLKFAEMETGLGEIDRARAVYHHASQFSNPATDPDFWKTWRSFEVAHGHEDTFKDMLRVKRSVQAQFSQVHFNAAELAVEDAPAAPLNAMEAAEAEVDQSV